ncbi:RNA polymerase II transcription factor B subunit 4 [Smittium mucronatum]|uniref:General transcription and DNA repair factor IIH subunit TFB4 n=1 Tax=Smittium mucronatum TaxID=133383 RepID=A0A1R0GX42_9FUNG|nr:RNA polymerase II transcription factor B subunit 4 [Smittium mucronatum]
MNCIFAAQKADIPIDVCRISKVNSTFLEQASDITGGNYIMEFAPKGLLLTLLFGFLSDQYTRQFVNVPVKKDVDFRAVCFCHQKIVDIGYVCSVCLSIFCDYIPICTTCK